MPNSDGLPLSDRAAELIPSLALDGVRARGIDVYHDHPVVSWASLEAGPEQIAFVGMKATEGNTFVDPKLLWHREGFRSSNLDLGIYYHFASPGNARDQAKRFVDTVGDIDPRERMCLDLERSPAAVALSLQWVTDFYDELLGNVCTDRRCFIYTSKQKLDLICGGATAADFPLASEIDLWAPRYSTGGDLQPLVPAPWADRGWLIWQFSDGKIPPHSVGGVGLCDGNVWNGNRESLVTYVGASADSIEALSGHMRAIGEAWRKRQGTP